MNSKTNLEYRLTTIQNLKDFVYKKNMLNVAEELGVTIYKDGKLNKGWVGQTLDKIANTIHVNSQLPDGYDYELKSVKIARKNDEWLPAETMAITMFNPNKILNETFENSSLWHKLEKLIIVGCFYESRDPLSVFIKFIKPVDTSDEGIIFAVKNYWTHIRNLVEEGKIASYSSKGTSSGYKVIFN